jgi:hypothetical protein
MTNRKIVSMVLGATALLGASSAFATAVLPSTGNGELVLFVTDTNTGNSYAKNLGVTLDNILADGSVASTPAGTLSYSLPTFDLSTDSNFTSLITAATNAGDNVIWGVMGGDSVGNNLQATPRRFVQTSGVATPSLTNGSLASDTADFNTFLTSVNGNLLANASVVGTGTSGGQYGVSGSAGTAAATGFTGSVGTSGALGSTLGLYMFTSSNTSGLASAGSNNPAKEYVLTSLTLTSTGLSAVSSVPLPAGVWLLGSGLLGMLGVGRRRIVKAA